MPAPEDYVTGTPAPQQRPTARFETKRSPGTGSGYERWRSTDHRPHTPGDRREDVYAPVHRLLAVVACYDVSTPIGDILADLAGSDVHHESGVEWDNRPGNLTVLGHAAHSSLTQADKRAIAEDRKTQADRQQRLDADACDRCGVETDTLARSPAFAGERCIDCATETADGAEIHL